MSPENTESPIELSPEQKKAYQEKRAEEFMKEYLALVKKHRMVHVPLIEYSTQGIVAQTKLSFLTDEQMAAMFKEEAQDNQSDNEQESEEK